MPTIDSDAHVVESERTWDYMDKADQKYRPVIVKPRSGGNADIGSSTEKFAAWCAS